MTAIWRLRAAILTLVGVIGVHQGRYLFATPEHEHELAATHAYLTWLTPVVGALLFVAVAQLVAHLGRRGGAEPKLPRVGVLWLLGCATLLCAFAAQESLEIVVHGRLPELGDVLGDGGWTACPFAVAAGGAIALVLRGAAVAVGWARMRGGRRARHTSRAPLVPRAAVLAVARPVMARRLAGRAPPARRLSC